MEWSGTTGRQALVLGGGGSKGSWQAGVISWIGENGVVPGGFEMVSGTSVGSINGAGIASFRQEEFREASAYVADLWKRRVRRTKDIWTWRTPRYVAGLFNLSLGKTKPLRRLLRDVVRVEAIQRSNVKLCLPAVSLEDGKIRRFTNDADDIVAALMASSSFPLFFPPEKLDGHRYTDGGVRDVVPLEAIVNSGVENILIIHTAPPELPPHRMKNVIDLAKFVIDIMSNEILLNDIAKARHINELIADGAKSERFRRVGLKVIGPSENLGDPLDFSGALMNERFEKGRQDAAAAFGY